MTDHRGRARSDRPFEPEQRRFLSIAVPAFDATVADWRPQLPQATAKRACDEARRAFAHRANADLDGFRDERGRLSRPLIIAYVTDHALLRLDRERAEFLDIAATVLADAWAKRLAVLPYEVGELGYEATLAQVTRRALKGVSGFRGASGRQSPDRIRGYVKFSLDRKVKGAWAERVDVPPPVSYDVVAFAHEFGHWQAADEPDEEAGDAGDAAKGSLFAQACEELERRERASDALEYHRRRAIGQGLRGLGIASHERAVVLARTARSWRLAVVEDELLRSPLGPASWNTIAERLAISSAANARQIYSRTLARLPLPLLLRLWIEDPESFEMPDELGAT